jgi:hypothetical protein
MTSTVALGNIPGPVTGDNQWNDKQKPEQHVLEPACFANIHLFSTGNDGNRKRRDTAVRPSIKLPSLPRPMMNAALTGDRGLQNRGAFVNRLIYLLYAIHAVTLISHFLILIYGLIRAM